MLGLSTNVGLHEPLASSKNINPWDDDMTMDELDEKNKCIFV